MINFCRQTSRSAASGASCGRVRRLLLLIFICNRLELGDACSATLFGDDMSGWHAVFHDGDYDYPQFLAMGAKDNEASAIKVEGFGCEAVLYGDAAFGGWHATFGEGTYHYTQFIKKGAHNDQASAIQVGHNIGNTLEPCKDTSGWADQFGHGCKAYEKDGHCSGGKVHDEWITAPAFESPQLHCCACGGGSAAGAKQYNAECKNTPGWRDPFKHACDAYVTDGHCQGGRVVHEWVAASKFNNPHHHCCACGKK